MRLDAKIKKLKTKKVTPEVIELLEHLIEQSQLQACEGVTSALENTQLTKDLKALQNNNTAFLVILLVTWLAIFVWAVCYG